MLAAALDQHLAALAHAGLVEGVLIAIEGPLQAL